MQLTKIAIASAALMAVATQAQAVVRMSGATATSNNYVIELNKGCSGGAAVYKSNTTANNLGNQFTVKCFSGNFVLNGTNTGENEVRFDVTGGSINSILFSTDAQPDEVNVVGAPKFVAAPAAITTVPAGCTTKAGTGVLSFIGAGKLFTGCTAGETGIKSDGGFTDVEPAIFQATGVLVNDYSTIGTVAGATFSQAFGVAVSPTLYCDLQKAQGFVSGTNCNGLTTPANQPSISRAKLASLMNADDFAPAKALGPKFLLPTTTQTDITYCRRPNTSGTQASAQLFFMDNPVATGALQGALTIHGPDAEGSADEIVDENVRGDAPNPNRFIVKMNSGSSNVRTCLSNASGYYFGVLSAENNPIGSSADTYRFVKIDGKSVTAGVAGDSQTANAIAGDYDFVYESALYIASGASTGAQTLMNAMNASMGLGAAATTPGLFRNTTAASPETRFSRGGNSVSPFVAR